MRVSHTKYFLFSILSQYPVHIDTGVGTSRSDRLYMTETWERLIAPIAIPDRTPVVRVLRKQRHLLIKFVEGSC